jgi:hypothetical protein
VKPYRFKYAKGLYRRVRLFRAAAGAGPGECRCGEVCGDTQGKPEHKLTGNKGRLQKHLVEAYGYIAAYKANTQKDYAGAIDYFDRLLAPDPGNADAARYVGILKKNLSKMAEGGEQANGAEMTSSSSLCQDSVEGTKTCTLANLSICYTLYYPANYRKVNQYLT